jgi:hypothetical protein
MKSVNPIMSFGLFMATEGGRKCPQCGKYAKQGELGNLSRISISDGILVHVTAYGHKEGFGCNKKEI